MSPSHCGQVSCCCCCCWCLLEQTKQLESSSISPARNERPTEKTATDEIAVEEDARSNVDALLAELHVHRPKTIVYFGNQTNFCERHRTHDKTKKFGVYFSELSVNQQKQQQKQQKQQKAK